jgi:small GTP-binding protein
MTEGSSMLEYKIILLGEKSVGKSSLITRYIMDTFDSYQPPTIGTAFYSKHLTINDQYIKLMIWDTCGEEKFRAISSLYFKDSDAAILVYDLSSPPTIEGVEYYVGQLGSHSPEDTRKFPKKFNNRTVITIVGNKCDLVEDEGYNVSAIENLLQDINGFYTITSAKNGIGIDVNILSALKNIELETF